MTTPNSVGRATPITAATVTQRATAMPVHKYGRYEQVDLPDRVGRRGQLK